MWLEFCATRVITKGNLVFRDKIRINVESRTIQFCKRNWYGIGHTETNLNFSQVASIQTISNKEWLFFCDISIETVGGLKIITNGFTLKDCASIKNLIS